MHALNSSSQHDEASPESPVLFSPTPTRSITKNKWPSPPPSLNDPHVSEDIIYTIIPALCQQMEAVMCVVVLVLPHLTPQQKINFTMQPMAFNKAYLSSTKTSLKYTISKY